VDEDVQIGVGAHQSSIHWVPGALSLEGKAAGT
jgi:hypothetical protein